MDRAQPREQRRGVVGERDPRRWRADRAGRGDVVEHGNLLEHWPSWCLLPVERAVVAPQDDGTVDDRTLDG
ncbi:hypothetical protein [Cellulosimicrobium cellulans]|uniref:Uncharacterized protein n=1 Tax=Cellulosimicrobium cellulans TaxID=1710 RepID=A0A4Y4DUH4_CELCE|nr:hypothetical protein [Cellulosimicrobium cellulans]GED09022.1 hypothetical protein CCE02nite_10210 [Cellulosimicrobium cellulans]